jgi:hypothetical protein
MPTCSGSPGSVINRKVAAGDVDAYRATFPGDALREPAHAAAVANRLMAVGRIKEAGEVLEAAGAKAKALGRDAQAPVDFDWESSCIDYLEKSGQGEAAQAARWASFERTLSVERAGLHAAAGRIRRR